MGNAGVLLRAYVYMRMLGREGMRRVGEYATLNANYLSARLQQAGFDAAYPQRRASHEFILTLKRQAQEHGVTAMDVAKRLLDLGFHAPTTYFPLLISECLLIEPTETESKQTLDAFVAAMAQILREAQEDPEQLQARAVQLPVRRLDDVRAARELISLTGSRRVMEREQLQGLGRMLRAFASSAKGFVRRVSRRGRHFARNCCSPAWRCRWGCGSATTGSSGRCCAAPVLLILIVELLNSAIEATVDRIGLERHELAGLAKDIGSAAVCCPSSCWAWCGCWCSGR